MADRNGPPSHMSTRIRLLDLGKVSALRSQSVYHAVALTAGARDAPTLCVLRPDRAYVSIGYHQEAAREIELAYCRDHDIPVVRRMVGGGAVLLDEHQLFFHLVVPRERLDELRLPLRFDERYARLVAPAIAAYRKLGVCAELRAPNDIQVAGKKIGGTGMADIESSLVFVGSMMLGFDHASMARVLRFADESLREPVRRSIERYVTSLERELGARPSMESVRNALLSGFRETLDVELESGTLSAAEESAAAELDARFASDEWLHRVAWHPRRPRKLVINGAVRYAEGETAEGTRVVVRVVEGKLDQVICGGDAADRGAIAALTRELVETASA